MPRLVRHRRRLSLSRPIAGLALAGLVLAACGGGGGGSKGSPTAKPSDLPACPLGAIAKAASKPVTITMWHSMSMANEATLKALTDRFNASQPDVRVQLVNETSYDDTLTNYKAALGGGTLPDLVQIQDVDQQLMIDSKSILPVESCIRADKYPVDDLIPRVNAYYTVRGVQYALPFSVSNPVLYYNRVAFQKAGLDPDKPPTTLDEVRTAAQKMQASGVTKYGIALKIETWHLEEWLAMAGQPFVNNGNGRDKRATKTAFDSAQGQAIFQWLAQMSKDGVLQTMPASGYDNMFAVANGVAGMTVDTSAVLGTAVQLLASGQYKDVSLGTAKLPGPGTGGGGTVVAGSALYIPDKNAPEKQEAAWRFARFLTEPQQMADWAAGTGYIPINEKSVQLPTITDLWAKTPGFRVAYDQLLAGQENTASAGALIGDFEGVRRAIVSAEESVFQGADPAKALSDAAAQGDRAIADYEARVGG
ncbi:MAG TPA: ABC transporter substrate-binding protein [Acidimicrobiales bacterium]|nr:ABC transporter substrate-binding protein [Acidimicrobiales bacterium]